VGSTPTPGIKETHMERDRLLRLLDMDIGILIEGLLQVQGAKTSVEMFNALTLMNTMASSIISTTNTAKEKGVKK
jgi:hypothetical protein